MQTISLIRREYIHILMGLIFFFGHPVHTDTHTYIHTDRHPSIHTYRQTDRQDWQTETHTHTAHGPGTAKIIKKKFKTFEIGLKYITQLFLVGDHKAFNSFPPVPRFNPLPDDSSIKRPVLAHTLKTKLTLH